MARIWVDTESGTWGDAASIVFVKATEEEIEELDYMSDSEVTEWALERNTQFV